MSDDPVIAALERCALPDGITSIDAQAVAGIVRARLARFGTPEQQARMLDELGDGTATFALVDMRGDYVLLMNNPETYGTREVGQFSRSSVDEQGRLSSFWTMTVHGPWLEPPTAGPVIAAFAGLAVAAATSAFVGFFSFCDTSSIGFALFGWAMLLIPILLTVILVTSRRKGPARTVLCTATGGTTVLVFMGLVSVVGCVD